VTRSEVRQNLVIALALSVVGVLVVAFSIAPLAAAPLLAALGNALVLTRVRAPGA
jgi:cation transport ATPase